MCYTTLNLREALSVFGGQQPYGHTMPQCRVAENRTVFYQTGVTVYLKTHSFDGNYAG